MKRNFILRIGIILATMSMPILLFASPENKANSIIKKVLKKYEQSKNIKVDFLQTFNWKLTENVSEQKGTIWLEGKEKFKIETEDQTIVSDGNNMWIYSKTNNQVIVDKVANAEDINLPRDILLNFSDQYTPSYIKEERIKNQNCFLIELSSKGDDQFIKQVKIWIETKNFTLVKIEQIDLNENVNSYLLSNFETNVPISASFFKYEIPDTVEVIDMR